MSPQDKELEEALFGGEDSDVTAPPAEVTSDGYDYLTFMLAFTDLFNLGFANQPSRKAFMAPALSCSFALN